MTALTLRNVEAADRLALARLDNDGAPAAVTSVVSPGSAKNARILAGAAAGAPAAIPAGGHRRESALLPDSSSVARSTEDGGHAPATHLLSCLALSRRWTSFRAWMQRVAVHRDEWDDIPRKLIADNGHFVMVDRFTTISRHTVSVATAGGREPIALLVVPQGSGVFRSYPVLSGM